MKKEKEKKQIKSARCAGGARAQDGDHRDMENCDELRMYCSTALSVYGPALRRRLRASGPR